MKILVIEVGYVRLATTTVLAELGNDVLDVDVKDKKIVIDIGK